MEINLELEKAVKKIITQEARIVCLQLPDGLKPKAKEIQDYLKQNTSAEIIIWAGSCFGSCDIPNGLEKIGVDLLIQWGHNE